MLGRRYNAAQWASLVILGAGVACIQLAPKAGRVTSATQTISNQAWTIPAVLPKREQLIGLIAVVVSCFASAIAATYFELVIKRPAAPNPSSGQVYLPIPTLPTTGRLSIQLEATLSPTSIQSFERFKTVESVGSGGRRHTVALLQNPVKAEQARLSDPVLSAGVPEPPSLWIKNIQLALFSLLCTTCYGFATSGETVSEFVGTFFEGFNGYTWAVIGIQAVGGLLTALVVSPCRPDLIR